MTADDVTICRDHSASSPRDNSVFELGLSLGLLGVERVFVVNDKSIKLLTDYQGIQTFSYKRNEKSEKATEVRLKPLCNQILKEMRNSRGKSEIKLLPSFALGVSYFYNFIIQICKSLQTAEEVIIEIDEQKAKLKNFTFKFIIHIPEYHRFSSPGNFQSYEKQLGYKTVSLIANSKSFRNIKVKDTDFLDNKQHVIFYDIPQLLTTAGLAVNMYLRNSTNAKR